MIVIVPISEYKDITDFPAQFYMQINNCGMRSNVRQNLTLFRPRGRRDHYLLYLQSGDIYIEHGDTMLRVPEGSCLYYPPNVRHLYTFDGSHKPTTYYYVHFTGVGAQESMALLPANDTHIYPVRDRTLLENHFHRLQNIYFTNRVGKIKSPMSFPEINAVLLELIDVLIRSARPAARRRPNEIMLASSYILEHFQEDIDLEKCAADAHLSMGRFAHLFTECMGISPRHFILSLRIDSAKELLLYSSLQIGEIAASVGFPDPSYFSRLFKKYTGVSPQAFRDGRTEHPPIPPELDP